MNVSKVIDRLFVTIFIINILLIQGAGFESETPLVVKSPSPEEEKLFNDIIGRILSNKEQFPHSVDDVLDSFENPIEIIVNCENNANVNQVKFQISTTFINWTDSCGTVAGCYIWNGEDPVIENKIKTFLATNLLILNYNILTSNNRENIDVGKIDNDGILYHELLHGQLLVDTMKNDEDLRSNVCNCANYDVEFGGSGKGSIANEIHKKIYDLQDTYIGNRAEAIDGTIIKRTLWVNADPDGSFVVDIDFTNDFKDSKNAVDLKYWISPVENIKVIKYATRSDYKIRIGGEVVEGENRARVRSLVDPDQIIVMSDIFILVPTPTISPDHSSLPEYSTCEECHTSKRGSSINLFGLLILCTVILIVSILMITKMKK